MFQREQLLYFKDINEKQYLNARSTLRKYRYQNLSVSIETEPLHQDTLNKWSQQTHGDQQYSTHSTARSHIIITII